MIFNEILTFEKLSSFCCTYYYMYKAKGFFSFTETIITIVQEQNDNKIISHVGSFKSYIRLNKLQPN